MATAMSGANHRVVQITHPWLKVLAQNYDGHAALLLQASLPADMVVGDGRGFTVKITRSGTDEFVRITSKESFLPPIFLSFVEYVLARSAEATTGEDSLAEFVAAIDQFRRFGARVSGRLSEEQVRGLFAELQLLHFLDRECGVYAGDILQAWGGPFGGLHDLEFANGYSIEVKSSHQPPREVRITSPDQLAPVEAGLDLLVLPMDAVSATDPAGIAFLDVVQQTRALAERGGPLSIERWELALAALDLDLEDDYYRQWHFLPGEWLRFTVSDGFPAIRPEAVPLGVVKVSFSLRLSALDAFSASLTDLTRDGAV